MHRPILLIDDDDDLRLTLRELLEASGYHVLSFGDAGEALEELRTGVRPSVILLDLMMPRMNGWQFCEAQSGDPQLASIPVVVMTARADVMGLAGSVDVLHKPFSIDSMLELISAHAGAPASAQSARGR